MQEINWVLYACAAVWLGLGAYLFALGRGQAALAVRVSRLEAMKGGE